MKRPPLHSPEYDAWWDAATQEERDEDMRRVWAYPSAVFFQDLTEAYHLRNFTYSRWSPWPSDGKWLRWVEEQAAWLRRVDAGDCFYVDYAPPWADAPDLRPTDYTWTCGCNGPYDKSGRVIISDCDFDCAEYAAYWDNLPALYGAGPPVRVGV